MNWFPGSGCGRSVLVHWRKSSCVFVARAHCCLKKNWSQDEKGTFHSGLALSVIALKMSKVGRLVPQSLDACTLKLSSVIRENQSKVYCDPFLVLTQAQVQETLRI